MVVPDRVLRFEGCHNARDLGGLPTADGRRTRHGAVARSDALDGLTAAGWRALHDHGVRTIIDLRNDDERRPDAGPRPGDIETVHIALDGGHDPDFWARWRGPAFCTPAYFGPHLERFPEISARVLSAIARAGPGGVLFHCVSGRDRTGLVAMLLLSLAGVAAGEIAADHALSEPNLDPIYERRGNRQDRAKIEAFLAKEGKTTHQLILETLASLDVAALLRRGGIDAGTIALLRTRLLG
jgi:protein-tyrosine phosphatase